MTAQTQSPAVPAWAQANFETMQKAAADGRLALLSCLDAKTQEPRYVIVAVGDDDGGYTFTPFGHLHEGNPFEAYLPPE